MAKRGERKLYFAYGSNMDEGQMATRCPGAVPVGLATLPDYALSFGGHSSTWGGGVATVAKRHGAVVRGGLYRLSEEDFALLDRYEGVPGVYQRQETRVLDEDGCQRAAQLYVLGRQHWAAPPSPRYLDVLSGAYQSMDYDVCHLLRAASGTRVFVYGTLMRGEGNHALLQGSFGVGEGVEGEPAYLGVAKTLLGYTMFDFGGFPAVVDGGSGLVRGEVYDVGWTHLQGLDALERHPDWYRRTLVPLQGGDEVDAYLMPAEKVRGKRHVYHGCWRTYRRGGKS